jgi:hypothetical protein
MIVMYTIQSPNSGEEYHRTRGDFEFILFMTYLRKRIWQRKYKNESSNPNQEQRGSHGKEQHTEEVISVIETIIRG